MRLGFVIGGSSECKLCGAKETCTKVVNDKVVPDPDAAQLSLLRHLQRKHHRMMVHVSERKDRKGNVTRFFEGVGWKNDMERE